MPATLIWAGVTVWRVAVLVAPLVAPLVMVASLCWLSHRRRSPRSNDSFAGQIRERADSHVPARWAAGGRVVAAFQPGADGCLQVCARPRRRGGDAADRGAQRPGHVHPGALGFGGGAAHPAGAPA